jgi:hypothetical protein
MSFIRLCLCALSIVSICGCSTSALKESWRGFAGTSTAALTQNRPSAACHKFNCSLEECEPKLAEVLAELKNYVYAREPGLTAVYVSENDTTPVGIFVSRTPSGTTKVEVSSPSSFSRDAEARRLFALLERKLKAKKIEVQLDAIEGK